MMFVMLRKCFVCDASRWQTTIQMNRMNANIGRVSTGCRQHSRGFFRQLIFVTRTRFRRSRRVNLRRLFRCGKFFTIRRQIGGCATVFRLKRRGARLRRCVAFPCGESCGVRRIGIDVDSFELAHGCASPRVRQRKRSVRSDPPCATWRHGTADCAAAQLRRRRVVVDRDAGGARSRALPCAAALTRARAPARRMRPRRAAALAAGIRAATAIAGRTADACGSGRAPRRPARSSGPA